MKNLELSDDLDFFYAWFKWEEIEIQCQFFVMW